jgi:multidrug resistance efflux pump
MIATPFEATLLRTNIKPGDTVKTGDVLVELDGRPLRLEREAIEAEIQQVAKEHDVALATRRIAESQQAALKKQQLIRQHELLSDRLGRLKVVSPIDGVVVSGDLEKFVGSPLERGQTLIEVAPMNQMVIEIEIPEHEIGYVKKGADARVKLDAIGGKSIRKPLSDVFPSAELRDDHNVFIGRIEVDNGDHKLKPGMRGEATAYGPLRPWIWSWVRGGFERTLWWIGY